MTNEFWHKNGVFASPRAKGGWKVSTAEHSREFSAPFPVGAWERVASFDERHSDWEAFTNDDVRRFFEEQEWDQVKA